MIIAILTLGGAILGATTLAGILMLYQIRATTDAANSAKAIFAADAGIEWVLYSYFFPPQTTPIAFSNGATVVATCYDATGAVTACDNTGATSSSYAIARGSSLNDRRAFFIGLVGASGTLP